MGQPTTVPRVMLLHWAPLAGSVMVAGKPGGRVGRAADTLVTRRAKHLNTLAPRTTADHLEEEDPGVRLPGRRVRHGGIPWSAAHGGFPPLLPQPVATTRHAEPAQQNTPTAPTDPVPMVEKVK